MKDIRLLVAGGQAYCDDRELDRVLRHIHAKYGIAVLIEGEAPGADRMARGWANLNLITVEPYPIPATDGYLGARAPFRRNQRMLDEGRPDMLVAFPGGPGTRDMVARYLSKIPCLVGLYTGGVITMSDGQPVQVGPNTIGWTLQ